MISGWWLYEDDAGHRYATPFQGMILDSHEDLPIGWTPAPRVAMAWARGWDVILAADGEATIVEV